MLVCDLPTFQQHYLPFDPAERDVDNVLDSLEIHVEVRASEPLANIFSYLEACTLSFTQRNACNYRLVNMEALL